MSGQLVTLEFERGEELVEVTIYPSEGSAVEAVFSRERFAGFEERSDSERELAELVVEAYLSERSDWSSEPSVRSVVCGRCGYEWEYSGESEHPTCPCCTYKTGY